MEDLNLTEICRICLTKHKNMQLVVEDDVIKKLLDCVTVQLSSDSLICDICKNEVNKWYSFKQQVLKSIEFVNRIKKEEDMHQPNIAINDERCIKTEPLGDTEVKKEREEVDEENETNNLIQCAEATDHGEAPNPEQCTENELPSDGETPCTKQCICDCGQAFLSFSELLFHRLTHREEPPEETKYQCDLCHKTFQSKTGFVWHQKMHSALKLSFSSGRFPCPRCPMVYEKRASLVGHLRWKHEIVKIVTIIKKQPQDPDIFRCPICKKEYKTAKGLNSHKLAQHNERPYKCLICNKEFTLKKYLYKHERRHRSF